MKNNLQTLNKLVGIAVVFSINFHPIQNLMYV